MKKTLAVLVVAGIATGGAGVALAQTGEPGDRLARRQAVRTCTKQARQATPDADRSALRDAVKACLAEMGIQPRLTDEQKEQGKACLQEAKAANPDADKATVRAAARPCLEQAGILPPLTPEQQARRAALRACFEQARADHPGDRQAIRQAVKECARAS